MTRTRRPPPPNSRLREALEHIDASERAKEICGKCGKPVRGVLMMDYRTGRTQTRAEAGLCECSPITQICAWCNAVIQEGRRQDVVSHGICETCQKKHFPEAAA